MSSYASPITSNGVDGTVQRDAPTPSADALLAATVFAQMLRPLTAALGPLGEMLVDDIAQRIALPQAR